jgi:hypothetical protein
VFEYECESIVVSVSVRPNMSNSSQCEWEQ